VLAGVVVSQHDGAQQLVPCAPVSGIAATSTDLLAGLFTSSAAGAAQQVLEGLKPRIRFPRAASLLAIAYSSVCAAAR